MIVKHNIRDAEIIYINSIIFTLNYTEYGKRLHLWRNNGDFPLCEEPDRTREYSYFSKESQDNKAIDDFVDFAEKKYKGKFCTKCKSKLPPF